MIRRACAFAALVVGGVSVAPSALGSDGLRVAAWNITFYTGGQGAQVGTAVYGEFNGNRFAPDVIMLQEMGSVSAVNALVGHLNSASGSPGDWAAGTTFTNSNANTALVYRTSRLTLIDSVLVSPGGASPNHPRHVVRYDLRLAGYEGEAGMMSFYPTHMKAGSGSGDIARRQEEVDEVLADSAALPAGRHYFLGGDFNTQSSFQSHFVSLVGSPYNTGAFRDPITVPGSWQNNSTYRNVHTQDPATQVDDRYDLILFSPSMADGLGIDYIGDASTPWNLSTWNDPNHSYRCWGNDGSSYNTVLATTGNVFVGASIAQALISLSSGLGHLPVYLDARVPARTAVSETVIDLGDVAFGTTPDVGLAVGSAGDTGLWGSAIEQTSFELFELDGVSVPAGVFVDDAGGALVDTGVLLTDTALVGGGPVSGSLMVVSNDDAEPSVVVTVNAEIVGCNGADFLIDGVMTPDDINLFVTYFTDAVSGNGDVDGDGDEDADDLAAFVSVFVAGCP